MPAAIARTAVRLLSSEAARQNVFHEWRRRLRGEPALPEGPVERVLVLCKGNICRSPFAATLLAARAPRIEVRSAGLEASGGDPADPSALRAARRRGIDLEAHRTRPVLDADLAWAQLVLGMEGAHAAVLADRWPAAGTKVRLLGHFLPAPPFAIDDPWGRSDEVFDRTFERIARAVDRLVDLVQERRE